MWEGMCALSLDDVVIDNIILGELVVDAHTHEHTQTHQNRNCMRINGNRKDRSHIERREINDDD